MRNQCRNQQERHPLSLAGKSVRSKKKPLFREPCVQKPWCGTRQVWCVLLGYVRIVSLFFADRFCQSLTFNIRLLGRTPAGALSAFLTRTGRFWHISSSRPLKIAPDDFCASAWLFTGVNGGRFQQNMSIRVPFFRERMR